MRSTAYVQQETTMTSVLKLLQDEWSNILCEVKDSENNILRAMEQSQSSISSDNRDDTSVDNANSNDYNQRVDISSLEKCAIGNHEWD